MNAFTERFNELKEEKGLNNQQIAEYLHITHVTVSLYGSGRRFPSTAIQEGLADLFNVDVDYLMGRTNIRRKKDIESLLELGLSSSDMAFISAYRSAPSAIKHAIAVLLGIKDYE